MADLDIAQSPSSAISNLVVRTVSGYTGRGPTRARTFILDDVITVVLEDNLTKAEQHLVQAGLDEQIEALRLSFKRTIKDELIAGVQEIMGREVRAYLTANHLRPDIAVETFILKAVEG
ncbi:hypothetical protein DSM112329_03755 [Paraconexibacter sp. AEG42_29]|uniref:Na+-translocating membrane potential-generating system MpsC domain-containing protein n=1 Tax=Paraconexibacter sp. AEG42_29 TaxID=2997339 RepID=A0AAU7AZQ0_9ACTN